MGRYGRRISRSLIGALIVTLVLGSIFYLKNLTATKADEANTSAQNPAPRATPAIPTPPVAIKPVVESTPPPLETSTPTAPPATPPVVAISPPSGPATKPGVPPAPAPSQTTAGILSLAQTRRSAGDLLGSRKLLNDALLTGSLSPADASAAKKSISEINQDVIFSPKRFADDIYGGTYTVQSGERLARIASKFDVTWELLMRLNGMTDPTKLRAGQALKYIKGPLSAVVSKSNFTLDIYLGPPLEKDSMYVTTYKVGLGKDDSTPTGTWLVEVGKKLKNPTYFSPRQEGIIEADDPQNPLGERWIGLTGIDGHAIGKASYGIHGTIHPESIGKMESMGCIRLVNSDVEWVFDLLVEGKSIVIVKE